MSKNLLIAAVLGLAFALCFAWSSGEAPFHAETVQCYPSPQTGSFPAVKPSFAPDDKLQYHRDKVDPVLQSSLAAAQRCAFESCDAGGLKVLKRELKQYLGKRRIITRNLVNELGDDGLNFAASVFTSERDEDLVAALRTLHASEQLDMASYREEKEALALLVLKPAQSFRPCTEGGVSRD